MKTIIIIRHAKSSWATIGQSDFDRPLNERGLNDAPKMASKLFQKNIEIDTFITSTANRAKTTCEFFAKAYNKTTEDILYKKELYNASESVFYEVIQGLDNNINNIAIFAHNPGISEFANSLCSNVNIYDMPTCGVFAVSANINNWANFEAAEKRFLFFEKP